MDKGNVTEGAVASDRSLAAEQRTRNPSLLTAQPSRGYGFEYNAQKFRRENIDSQDVTAADEKENLGRESGYRTR